MLRWNTPSAICAIMITACPLTSFAQQIVTPAPPEISIFQKMPPLKMPGEIRKVAYQSPVPLVSPQAAVAGNPTLQPPAVGGNVRTASLSPLQPMPPVESRTDLRSPPRLFNAKYQRPITAPVSNVEQRATSPKIIIRPPFVQPQNPNNYLFVVQNIGQTDATTAAVDLFVPDGVVITGVVPTTATATARRVHVRLTGLAAGAKSIIEVQVQPTTDMVEFQTRLSLESVHKFTTVADPDFATPTRTPPRFGLAGQAPVGAAIATAQVPSTVAPLTTPAPSATPTTAQESAGAASVSKPQKVALISPLTPLAPLAIKTPPLLQTNSDKTNSDKTTSDKITAANEMVNEMANGMVEHASTMNASAATLISTANRVTADANESSTAAATTADVSAAQANLSATVNGPVTLNANEVAEFGITVTNPNSHQAADIVVQLTVPAGLHITVLDREAWFDEENQTLSWEMATLEPGQQETIQYRAVATTTGQQNQKVTVGMQNVYQGKAQLVTLISN